MILNNFYTIAAAVHSEEEAAGGLAEKAESIGRQFGVDAPLLTAQVICFLILAYILWNFGFKKILGTMEEREKKISDGLRYAEEVKIKLEDAERKHTDTLKEASEEAQKTLATAREQAKNFEEQLRKDAEARAEDIVRKAGEQMELERQTMVAETKLEFAKLVVETSAKVLDRELADEEKVRFSEAAAKEITKV
jgi:F-type H+-transporting ATPase subunit b